MSDSDAPDLFGHEGRKPWRSLVNPFEGFSANRLRGESEVDGPRVQNRLTDAENAGQRSQRPPHPFVTAEGGNSFEEDYSDWGAPDFGATPGFSQGSDRRDLPDDETRLTLDEAHGLREDAEELRNEAARELEEARREAARVVTQAESEAAAESGRRLEEARHEAEAILEQARQQIEKIEADGYQAGFAQGEEAGMRLGEQKIEAVVRSLRTIVDEVSAQRGAVLQGCQKDLVKIAFLTSVQLLGRELKQDETVILDVIRNTVDRVRGTDRLTLHVSPQDHTFLEEHRDELAKVTGEGIAIDLLPDPEISRGGCRVVSESGSIDATLETMFRKLRTRLWPDLNLND